MTKRLFLWFFFISLKTWAWGQKIQLLSGNAFVMPSNSEITQLISLDTAYLALTSYQKLSGNYHFGLLLFNKDLDLIQKIELDNSQNDFYNFIDLQQDTVRIFSAIAKTINGLSVVEYGYRILDLPKRQVKPAIKKLATRESLPETVYPLNSLLLNPYEYRLFKTQDGYHLYYFQRKKQKSIYQTYACLKVFDHHFNFQQYYQKPIPPFEQLALLRKLNNGPTGFDVAVKNQKNHAKTQFFHVYYKDSLQVTDLNLKSYFDKHLLDEAQYIGILGDQKPEFAYFLESNNSPPKDSLLFETIFNNQSFRYFFTYNRDKSLLFFFPYKNNDDLFSIHNIFITDLKMKKNAMLPYFNSCNSLEIPFILPIFWDNLCMLQGKFNQKNFFQPNSYLTYTFWNFQKQTIVQEFVFNEPYALNLSRPFLKNAHGCLLYGKYKDRFMMYRIIIQ